MNNKIRISSEDILAIFSGLSDEWCKQFDNPPENPLDFMIQGGELYLNGNVICPAELIDLDACFYDVENIVLALKDNSVAVINIIWPPVGEITTNIVFQPMPDVFSDLKD